MFLFPHCSIFTGPRQLLYLILRYLSEKPGSSSAIFCPLIYLGKTIIPQASGAGREKRRLTSSWCGASSGPWSAGSWGSKRPPPWRSAGSARTCSPRRCRRCGWTSSVRKSRHLRMWTMKTSGPGLRREQPQAGWENEKGSWWNVLIKMDMVKYLLTGRVREIFLTKVV